MRAVAVIEGTASNSFGSTVRIEGGGDHLGFSGNVVVTDPQEWSGSGTVKVALSDASALMRSEEHTSELQSLMRISYAVFCLKKTILNLPRSRSSTTGIT